MSSDFSTSLSAKWILAGEHAVVRQHPAIVFPLPYYKLSLTYEKTKTPWQLTVQGKHHTVIQSLFFSTLEHALTLTNAHQIDRTGSFKINSNIPLGSGLGASAAFCLAISQWLTAQGIIDSSNIYEMSKQLENIFHGKSSGIDIVGVGAHTGRYFHAGKHEPVHQTWQPHWYLSSSDSPSKTNKCIEQVNILWQKNITKARSIDEQMAESVQLALEALQSSEQGLIQLTEAINLARDCFQQWGLIDPNLQRHIDKLKYAGALVCKPTGSGSGGYVISLWAEPAPKLPWPMIPLQSTPSQQEIESIKDSVHYD